MAGRVGGTDPGTLGGLSPVLYRALKKKVAEVTLADLQQWHQRLTPDQRWPQMEQNANEADLHHRIIDQWYGNSN
jgi:hypothetical protein